MRTLSLTFRRSHTDEMSGEIDVMLVTIAHPDLVGLGHADGKIRLSSDPTERFSVDPLRYGTTSRSQEFEFLPFAWRIPEDGEEAQPTIPLAIANFSQDLVALLRSTTEPALVTCEVVAASAPDVVEIAFPEFDLTSVQGDTALLTITLSIDMLSNEPVPADTVSPAYFPGLF